MYQLHKNIILTMSKQYKGHRGDIFEQALTALDNKSNVKLLFGSCIEQNTEAFKNQNPGHMH